MAAISPEEQAFKRLERVQAETLSKEKKDSETLALLLEEAGKRLEAIKTANEYNEELDKKRQHDQAEQAKKPEITVLTVEEPPIVPVVYGSFVQQANGTIVAEVNYCYKKPKDEVAEAETTAAMSVTTTDMKNNSAKHLGLNPDHLYELDLDEASVVYHEDHMSAALKDGTKFTHRNHSQGDTSSIEYHLPEKHNDDLFAQAMRIGNISAMLAAMNHQKSEYGRWHQTRPVMVHAVPKSLDEHVSLYALAKSIEIFQLGHMGYKMMNPMRQELSFNELKQNTNHLVDFIHQKKLDLDLTRLNF